MRGCIVFLLLSVTVLQRFGLNFGSYSLNLAFGGMFFCLAVALVTASIHISLERLLLVGACYATAMVSFLVNSSSPRVSFGSLALILLMYLPYVAVLRRDALGPAPIDWVLRAFSNVALLCAVAGVLQFFVQFVYRPPWLFDYTPYIPSALRGPSGYNTVIPVGSSFKSNGFFFLEPSGASFLMALALVVEFTTLRRWTRMACFGLALLVTYSGTGILGLMVGTLFALRLRTMLRFVGAAVAAGGAYAALREPLNLDFTLGRVSEFNSVHSSAYHRYVAPFRLIGDTYDTTSWTLWLGHGPGSISREVQGYAFHDPTWAKLMFEYGVTGSIAFLALLFLALRRGDVPLAVRATLFFSWLVMGGHLLSPENNYLLLALVGLHVTPERVAHAERSGERLSFESVPAAHPHGFAGGPS